LRPSIGEAPRPRIRQQRVSEPLSSISQSRASKRLAAGCSALDNGPGAEQRMHHGQRRKRQVATTPLAGLWILLRARSSCLEGRPQGCRERESSSARFTFTTGRIRAIRAQTVRRPNRRGRWADQAAARSPPAVHACRVDPARFQVGIRGSSAILAIAAVCWRKRLLLLANQVAR